jgi:uncharacterized repeat protein (TIGR02543 family)
MLTAAALRAADFYVASDGSDTAAGTEAAPFRTIQRGVDAAATGDRVWVAPGLYANPPVAAAGKSRLAITKNITVRSTGGAAQTVIRGQPHSDTLRFGSDAIRCVYLSAGTLDGFTLENGFANAASPGSDMTDPVKNGGGVYTPDGIRDAQVVNCIIAGCGAYRGSAAHGSTLRNCTVVSNHVSSTSGAALFSCHVYNSIVMFNGPSNDENYPYEANSVDQSRFFFSCTSPAPGLNVYGETRDGGNNLTEDPLFAEGSLRLADNSPCINAGSNDHTNGTRAAAGDARVQGGTADMGAYERGQTFNTLTVIHGTGGGDYTNGAVVALTAHPGLAWQLFDGWTGEVATVTGTADAATTLIMPDRDITVVATYRTLTLDEYLAEVLGLPQPVTSGNLAYGDVAPQIPEVKLGPVEDGESAFLSTVYTNGGTLFFPWRVSSEAGYDELRLLLDGLPVQTFSGEGSGIATQAVTGTGPHTLLWEYRKDVEASDGADAGWVGAVTWIPEPLAAELGAPGHAVRFPDGQPGAPLPFPYGYAACFLDPAAPAGAAGGEAVRLGGLDAGGNPLFPDGSTNRLEVTLQGAGQLSFQWCASNQLSDTVICLIDGTEAARASGTKNGWLSFTTNLLTAAAHTVTWVYTKNASGFAGADAAWIDNVTWDRFTHTLTVENGQGGGVFPVGDPVTILADDPPAGQMFSVWDGDTAYLADPAAPSATLIMPDRDITLRALFTREVFPLAVVNGRDAGAWPNAVCEGTGEPEGAYPAGASVRLVAAPAPLWYVFDRWTASDPGAAFDDALAEVTRFTMPSNAVTVTASYRALSSNEKLGEALTIRGQPLTVSAFSPSGVVAIASGGVRYDDPVVQMGGPAVGPGQSVTLSTSSFTGDGVLLFWWHADAEAESDGLRLEVNGLTASPLYSEKRTNDTDKIWHLYGFGLTNVTEITWRFTRDDSYAVHQNIVLVDRVTWIPGALLDALGAGACIPNINAEYDPLFQGRNHGDGGFDFDGEDGGVAWVDDAPGGGGAIRLGRFGYVTNNLCAQVAFTNFGTGVLTWEWTASSEAAGDELALEIDDIPTNWISGKLNGAWYGSAFAVTSDRFQGESTLNRFAFRYRKDGDVSLLEDCAWLRNVRWHATRKLTVENGSVLTPAATEEGYYMAGLPVTILADPPAPGFYFDRWTGTNLTGLASAITNPSPTFIMPDRDLTLTATYTTNAPPVPHYTLTVANGSGSGSYESGTIVPILADAPGLWQTFTGWAGDTDALADPSASATTALIGNENIAVTATYSVLPVPDLIRDALGVPAPITFANLTADNIGADSVTFGPLADGQTAFFSTVYTNAGTVSFPWSVDSEEGYDFLTFAVDGTNLLEASGTRSGVMTHFVAGDGPHTLQWSYTKDVSDAAGSDRAVIGRVTWIPDALAAELGTPGKPLTAPDGFDAILLDDAPPAGAVGDRAVRFGGGGSVDPDGSVTLGTRFSGSGTLAFQWYASSEQSHDYLILLVNGAEAARISGTKDGWQTFTTNLLTVMEHDVRWRYQKDGSGSSGQDCGWVDSVTWTQFTQNLTVENGSGGGVYAVGQTVPVLADTPAAGMEFDQWDGDTETLADRYAAGTSLVMPGRDITVRALYRPLTLTVTVVNGRDGGAWPNAVHESTGEPEGAYPEGAEIRVIADPAPLWQTFDHWSAEPAGVVFADPNAAITTFTMPDASVTVTAVYRQQTVPEQLAGALTIAGQPLTVTAASATGVVAQAQGGIRYDDPVVVFGGPSIGAGQTAELTFTNFVGDGVLLFWWKGQSETAYDRVRVLVNGTDTASSVSAKDAVWRLAASAITGASSITLRFERDSSYFVRENTIAIDRVTWIPQELIDAFGCAPALPDINGETSGFDGEDGGVSWVTDAPGGAGAVRFGRFGYVNNSQHAQVTVTNYGTGILTWQWAASSEASADRLEFWASPDQDPTDLPHTWTAGKEESWHDASHVVRSGTENRETASKTLRTFLFKYSKDSDVSVLQDCVWMRQGLWTPTFKLTLDSAVVVSYTLPAAFAGMAAVIEEAEEYQIFPVGTSLTLAPEPAPDGMVFDSWEGDVFVLTNAVSPVCTFLMPEGDIALTATYVDAPLPPSGSGLRAASTITSLRLTPGSPDALTRSLTGETQTQPTVLTLDFTGAPQTEYLLEWIPSLSGDGVWQSLPIAYRQVLGDTEDGQRAIRLFATLPADTPQAFFRLRTSEP